MSRSAAGGTAPRRGAVLERVVLRHARMARCAAGFGRDLPERDSAAASARSRIDPSQGFQRSGAHRGVLLFGQTSRRGRRASRRRRWPPIRRSTFAEEAVALPDVVDVVGARERAARIALAPRRRRCPRAPRRSYSAATAAHLRAPRRDLRRALATAASTRKRSASICGAAPSTRMMPRSSLPNTSSSAMPSVFAAAASRLAERDQRRASVASRPAHEQRRDRGCVDVELARQSHAPPVRRARRNATAAARARARGSGSSAAQRPALTSDSERRAIRFGCQADAARRAPQRRWSP